MYIFSVIRNKTKDMDIHFIQQVHSSIFNFIKNISGGNHRTNYREHPITATLLLTNLITSSTLHLLA